ncbi:cupin domain-containing protein [Saccharopolyspora elongata]|uniref:Cupin domain-containing protein n=1 Tax=Saccharopolyspora elongata TaxID=2530387 RepID=A0A4R4Z175_9PSEU|nr:cupin domain-containing protein [Saccharopolyspora elongata]TDD51668.1 cupin domain-containing protein [Saccharopolyspora elongata]
MTQHDAFHPDLSTRVSEEQRRSLRTRLHHVRAADLDNKTAQTEGMRRLAAISGDLVGSERIWMGETHVGPSTASDNHHHGESETAIYVVSGHPEFVFHDGTEEVRIKTEPGDYIFVPPFVPHREENPDPNDPAEVVIARSTQEAIVVNLPELYHLEPGES